MLFICELEVLEGHPKPKHDHAIIEADSRDQAIEKICRAFPGPDVDALYLFEVPRQQWAKIPTDLIDKRMTKAIAEEVMIDCGMGLSNAARAILAKFPGPVTLQPSKEIFAFMFLVGSSSRAWAHCHCCCLQQAVGIWGCISLLDFFSLLACFVWWHRF